MLGQIIGLVGGVIDKAFPGKTEAAKIKGKVTEQMLSLSVQEIKSASSIIAAEFQLGYLMMIICGWYFTGGIVDSVKRK